MTGLKPPLHVPVGTTPHWLKSAWVHEAGGWLRACGASLSRPPAGPKVALPWPVLVSSRPGTLALSIGVLVVGQPVATNTKATMPANLRMTNLRPEEKQTPRHDLDATSY
jgi:hypothetical protein